MDAFTAFPSGLPSTLYTHLKASLTPLASRNMLSSRSSRECNYKDDASWTTTSVQWEYGWLKAMLVVLKPSLKLVQ